MDHQDPIISQGRVILKKFSSSFKAVLGVAILHIKKLSKIAIKDPKLGWVLLVTSKNKFFGDKVYSQKTKKTSSKTGKKSFLIIVMAQAIKDLEENLSFIKIPHFILEVIISQFKDFKVFKRKLKSFLKHRR